MTDVNAANDTLRGKPLNGFHHLAGRGCRPSTAAVCSSIFAATFFLFAFVLTGITGCSKEEQPEKITLAVAIQPLSAPIYVAQEKGFFKDEGLDVTVQSYSLGKDALAAVLKGTAQFGTVAETPLMLAGLKGEKFLIIATIADSNQYHKIVARKDIGIAGPKDLIDKRIGMSQGTTTDYYLDALLIYNEIPNNRVLKISLKPEELPEALAKGDIDAAVAFPPYTARELKILGSNAVTIENSKICSIYWNLVMAENFAKTNPEAINKLLRALIRAEQYINKNTAAVRTLMAKKIGDDALTMDGYSFELYQEQNLLLAMEDQARWAIRQKLTATKEVPNFLPLFYVKALKAVAPDSVSAALNHGEE